MVMIQGASLPYHTDCLNIVRSKCRDLWKQHFDERSLNKGIWYRTIQPNLCEVPWFRGSGMGRLDIVTALRLRSGHIPLNSFAFLMRKSFIEMYVMWDTRRCYSHYDGMYSESSRKMTIRWGIVSAGKISNDFVNAINSFPGKGDQAIVAVAARDRTRAAEFAKTHSIPKVFDSYQAMAESKGVIDVVYIGALNPDHYPLTKLFLERGKHVLCEKPLCLNQKQVQSLINIARKNKLFLMEAVWSRFAPAYLELEKEIASGKLGEVKRVEANFGVPVIGVDRLNKKDLGGSVVLDLGIYVLQLAQLIFKDEPTKVTVVGETNEDGVDISETIILEYSGGRRAVLNVDGIVKMWNKATITGTKGRATLEEYFHFPETLIRADGSVAVFKLHESKLPYCFGNAAAGLVYQSLEVVRCIKEGLLESPRMSHKESLILAKLEDTVRKQLGVHYDVDDQEF